MRDCTYCQNHREITNAYGEYVACPRCRGFLMREIKKGSARKALRAAREAITEKFARDLRDQRKAVS